MISGYRKAALHLYSLSEADRQWVMDNLTDEQSLRLNGLIDELYNMGIPAGRSWIDDFSTAVVDHEEKQDIGPVQYAELEIEGAEFSLLKSAMDSESVTVVALILLYRNWSWSDKYLESCESERRQRIVAIQTNGIENVRKDFLEEMVKELADKLSDPATDKWIKTKDSDHSRAKTNHGFRVWRLLWQR